MIALCLPFPSRLLHLTHLSRSFPPLSPSAFTAGQLHLTKQRLLLISSDAPAGIHWQWLLHAVPDILLDWAEETPAAAAVGAPPSSSSISPPSLAPRPFFFPSRLLSCHLDLHWTSFQWPAVVDRHGTMSRLALQVITSLASPHCPLLSRLTLALPSLSQIKNGAITTWLIPALFGLSSLTELALTADGLRLHDLALLTSSSMPGLRHLNLAQCMMSEEAAEFEQTVPVALLHSPSTTLTSIVLPVYDTLRVARGVNYLLQRSEHHIRYLCMSIECPTQKDPAPAPALAPYSHSLTSLDVRSWHLDLSALLDLPTPLFSCLLPPPPSPAASPS